MRRLRRLLGVLVTVCTFAATAVAGQQIDGPGARAAARKPSGASVRSTDRGVDSSADQDAAASAEQNAGTGGDQNATTPVDQSDPSKPADVQPLFFNVTVTAPSRVAEETGRTPQAATVATLDALERRQARTPNQMLREEPGVWSAQVSSQGSPIIRGQIGNRVLYLWDGIRLNNGALFSGPNGFFNQFPVGSVDRLEVLRGPGAVQYGSDAIGGVINIVQRSADSFTGRTQAGGDFTARYGSIDGEKTEFGNLWVASPRVSLFGGLTGQNIGDYRVPSGATMASTGIKSAGGYLNAAFKVNDRDRIKLSWVHDRRFDVETYAQSKLNASGLPRIFGPFEQRGVVRLDYQIARADARISEFRVYGYDEYYHSLGDNTTESASAFNRTRTDTNQNVGGGGAQGVSTFGPSRLVFGGDLRAEDLSAGRTLMTSVKATGVSTTTVPNGSVPPGTYDVADGFAMLNTTLSPALSWSGGLRVESAKLHSNPRPQDALTPFTVADLTLDKRWTSATWSTGAVYRVAGNWSVTGHVATGYRAPTFSDTLNTGVPVFASGLASVPSPGIDPERSITYEAGPRYASRRINLTATVYVNRLTDLLTSVVNGTIDIPGVGVVQAQRRANSSSAYVRGFESAVAYRLTSQLTLTANATITRGQDTALNVPLRFVPPANGTVSLLWQDALRGRWIEVSTMMADRLRRHAPQDELDAGFSRDPAFGSPSAANPALPGFQIPGWVLVNARGGTTVWKSPGGRQRLDLSLDLNNLLNAAYREAYSQQQLYAPGRGAVIAARVRY